MNEVYIAKLGKTIGLRGEIKIFIDSDFPEQFHKGAVFTTNRKQKLTVKSFNINKGTVYFEEINDVDEAKKLTNQELFTTLEDTQKTCNLTENQFFWFDIIGCEVIENDELLGKVKDIHRYPITDYLEVNTNNELVTSGLPKQFLIPYGDNFILNVDIESKKIVVKDARAILENS